VTEEKYGPQSR